MPVLESVHQTREILTEKMLSLKVEVVEVKVGVVGVVEVKRIALEVKGAVLVDVKMAVVEVKKTVVVVILPVSVYNQCFPSRLL